MFDAIDHVGVAVDDLEAALGLYEGTFGMPLVHRETVDEQGVEAALLDVGDGHVELLRPLGPDTPVGQVHGAQRRRAFTTSPTASRTSTPPSRSSPAQGVELIDSHGAHRDSLQPRGLRQPALDRRGTDRDRRTGGGPLMAERRCKKVEIGFGIGQVVSVRLTTTS